MNTTLFQTNEAVLPLENIFHVKRNSNAITQLPYHISQAALYHIVMMTSSNGNIIRVTGPLCREFTGHRSILPTKASDAELWCFL